MVDATHIPILLDGDTGYGDLNNMRRLVNKLEQRGVAGVCIEDKLFPKTNSFIEGTAQPQLIKTVHNPLFAESSSMYSLSLVRERVQEDFLLLESDLIYEQRALSVCQTYPQDNVVLLSGETPAGDEVFVESDNQNRLKAMSKDRHFLGDKIADEHNKL